MKIKVIFDSLCYLFGNVLTKAVSLISIPVYTYFLSISQYGRVSYFNSMVSIFTIVFSGLIYTSLSRYYYEKNKELKFVEFFSSFIVVQVVFSFFLFFSFFLINVCFEFEDLYLFALIGSLSLLKLINTTYFHIYQPRQLSSKVFYRQIVESTFVFSFSYLFLELGLFDGEYNIIYSQLLVFLVLAIWICIDLLYFFKLSLLSISLFNIKFFIKYTIKFSSFLWFSTIISTIILQMDKVYIKYNLSGEDLGVYALAFNIAFLVKVISVSLFASFTPRVMSMLSKGKDSLAKDSLVLIRVVIFISVCFLVLFSKELIMLMPNGNGYYDSVYLIGLISLSFWFDTISVSAMTYLSYQKTTQKVIIPYLISGFLFVNVLFFFDLDVNDIALLFTLSSIIISTLLVFIVGVRITLDMGDFIMLAMLLISFYFVVESILIFKVISFAIFSLVMVHFTIKRRLINSIV